MRFPSKRMIDACCGVATRARTAVTILSLGPSALEVTEDEAGFTLMEVLVALSILAVSLTVLFSAFTQGLEAAHRAQMRLEARDLAQRLLRETEAEPSVQLRDSEGHSGAGLDWDVRLMPYGDVDDRNAWPLNPVRIAVDVGWTEGGWKRAVHLSTLRLMPKAVTR